MAKRKFYKTVLQVEVLSEDTPINCENLDQVGYAITEGDCSGVVRTVSTVKMTGAQAAKALQEQGSDPEFFGLDSEGNEVEG